MKFFTIFIFLLFFSYASYAERNSEIDYKIGIKSGAHSGCDEGGCGLSINEFNKKCDPINYYCLNYSSTECSKINYSSSNAKECIDSSDSDNCFGEWDKEIKLFNSEQDCKFFYKNSIKKAIKHKEKREKLNEKYLKLCKPNQAYCVNSNCTIYKHEVPSIKNEFCVKACKFFLSDLPDLSNDCDKVGNVTNDEFWRIQNHHSENVKTEIKPEIDCNNLTPEVKENAEILTKCPVQLMPLFCEQGCGKTYDKYKIKKDSDGKDIVSCIDNTPVTPKTIVNNGEAKWNSEDDVRMGCMYVEGRKNPDIIYKMYEAVEQSFKDEGKDLRDKNMLLKLSESFFNDYNNQAEKNYKILNMKNSSWCIRENLVYDNKDLGKYFKCAGKLK